MSDIIPKKALAPSPKLSTYVHPRDSAESPLGSPELPDPWPSVGVMLTRLPGCHQVDARRIRGECPRCGYDAFYAMAGRRGQWVAGCGRCEWEEEEFSWVELRELLELDQDEPDRILRFDRNEQQQGEALDMVADADLLNMAYGAVREIRGVTPRQQRTLLMRHHGLSPRMADRVNRLVAANDSLSSGRAASRDRIVDQLHRAACHTQLCRVPEFSGRKNNSLSILPWTSEAVWHEPWADSQGRIVALRSFNGHGAKEPYTFSRRRWGAPVHFAFGAASKDERHPLWIITPTWVGAELVAHVLGEVGIAVSDPNSWHCLETILGALRRAPKRPIVLVALGADAWTTNPRVAIQMLKLATAIENATGFCVGYSTWDATINDKGQAMPRHIEDALASRVKVRHVLRSGFAGVLGPALDRWEFLSGEGSHKVRRAAQRLRLAWTESSLWGVRDGERRDSIDFGRIPLRLAIRPEADAVGESSPDSMEVAREKVKCAVGGWPGTAPRVALKAHTGTGKSTEGVKRCVRHLSDANDGIDGALLYVVPNLAQVARIIAEIRQALPEADPALLSELLGRQAIVPAEGESWATTRFGCVKFSKAHRSGSLHRQVAKEVCRRCPALSECRTHGYLAHAKAAANARVIVTTIQKLGAIPESLWRKIGAVICDEDCMPGLFVELWVTRKDLLRGAHFIGGLPPKSVSEARAAALRNAAPMMSRILKAMKGYDGTGPDALIELLRASGACVDEAESSRLAKSMPLAPPKISSGSAEPVYDPRAPAEWEQRRRAKQPRQVWGRFLAAFLKDVSVGDPGRAATIRVVKPPRSGQVKLHILSINATLARHLLERPLLVLDATMHPALAPLLRLEVEAVPCTNKRKITQVLGPLLRPADILGEDSGLSFHGWQAVAHAARFIDGRHAYILCSKATLPELSADAKTYSKLANVQFVAHGSERAWNADQRVQAFVVIGRYARNGRYCEREAHALRSAFLGLHGATETLERLEQPLRPQVFKGRGSPLRYYGELVERRGNGPADRLAAAIQDADAQAVVQQFIGRDRTGTADVLLIRGDPTIPADELLELAFLTAAEADAPVSTAPSSAIEVEDAEVEDEE